MNSNRVSFSLLMLLASAQLPAVADSNQYGQYFCFVEHAVGLQWKEETKPMFSGQIKLPEEDMKFFIKIGPVIYNDIAHDVCRHDMDYWFNEVFDKRLPYQDHAPAGRNADDRRWIGRNCFASNELTLKSSDGKSNNVFRGYGDYEYYGASANTWFHFYGDGKFLMGFGYDSGPVIEDGRCTKIEPPK
jgi:hypothetical protein